MCTSSSVEDATFHNLSEIADVFSLIFPAGTFAVESDEECSRWCEYQLEEEYVDIFGNRIPANKRRQVYWGDDHTSLEDFLSGICVEFKAIVV